MREYRGLTKEGKWAEGWYFKCGKDSYILNTQGFATMRREPLLSESPKQSYPLETVLVMDEDFIEVIPETVGQDIGLKDKNGKDRYFGDVVQDEGDRYIVRWDTDDGVAYLESCLDSSEDREIKAIKTCEVIGNIHESKESKP